MTGAQKFWYHRMMNVTARGYHPIAGNGIPSKPASEWSWSFSEDCPQDFINLFKAKSPEPNFIANPSDPVHGTWGEVSVWHIFMKTGYICSLNYDRFDTKSLTFSYDIMKDGKTIKQNAFTATAIKAIQLRSHLRELWLDGYDPKYDGLEVIVDDASKCSMFGACSSVRLISADRKTSFQGRNFDFTYDDKQTYVIHVRDTSQSFAFNCIVKDLFKDGTYTRLLPNMAVDGINEKGVCVNINVVSKKDLDDYGEGFANVRGTKPGATRVHMLCMPSVILAHADSAVAALKIMSEADIYGDLVGLEHVHFMISDKDDTFVVEVIGDKLKIRGFSRNDHNDCGYVTEIVGKEALIMTNWYLCNDSQPRFPLPYVRGKYTPNACGIERYDLLRALYTRGGYEVTEQETVDMLKAVRFTNQVIMDPATDKNYPFSDFGWGSKWTQEDYLNDEDFKQRVDSAIESIRSALASKDRTKGVWITSHNTTYDLTKKTTRLVFEEDYDSPMCFDLWLRDK